jgi:S1-C subfamily serine protease
MRRVVSYCVVIVLTSIITAGLLHGLPLAAQGVPGQPPGVVPVPPGMEKVDPADLVGLAPDEIDNVRIYQIANRGVVNITSRGTQQDDFFIFEIPREGTGSGAVIDKQGHIVTNYHVVEDARQVVVNLYDSSSYPAEVVGVDPNNELAVIKINAPEEKLFPIPWGDSSKLLVGLRVYALGNPFGLERTLTLGIVSSLNRTLKTESRRTIKGVIQTDAAINPGNSGGPLLNRRGEMVGINTAIVTRAGQSAGIGLAVPSNTARRIVADLVRFGRVHRPDLGINAVYETERGLLIAQLAPNGPATAAGLRGPQEVNERRNGYILRGLDRTKADFIVGIDGRRVKNFDDLLSYIESKKPGDTVQITIIREGRRQQVPVQLELGK